MQHMEALYDVQGLSLPMEHPVPCPGLKGVTASAAVEKFEQLVED